MIEDDRYEDEKYNFYFQVEGPYENVGLSLENVCGFGETELELYLDVFERFLKAVSFYTEGKHLELVEDYN